MKDGKEIDRRMGLAKSPIVKLKHILCGILRKILRTFRKGCFV